MPTQMTIKPDVSPGEISRDIKLALQIAELPSVDYKDYEAVKNRVSWYFLFCSQNDERPCIQGLALALHTNRQTLLNWEKENTGRGECIRTAKQIIRYQLEKWSLTGKLNPATSIFWAKNFLSMSDSITIEARTDTAPQAALTPEQIAAKIEDDIPVDPEPVGIIDSTEVTEV